MTVSTAARVFLLVGLSLAARPASAQWQYIGPSGSYNHTDFAVRAGVFALSMSGSGSSGLLVSTDGALTWTVPTLTFPGGGTPRPFTDGVRSVVALPTGFMASLRETGAPDGQTWFRPLASPPGAETFNAYRHHYETRARRALYATNYAPAVGAPALLRSLDDAATWTAVQGPFTRLSFVHARGDTLVAGLAVAGAWVSTDGGTTWADLSTRGVAGAGVAGFVAPDGRLYVVVTTGNFLGTSRLYRSTDAGQTWTLLTDAISPAPPDTPNSRTALLHVEGRRILFSGACQIYLSEDSGATWALRSEGLPACTSSGSSRGGISQLAFVDGTLYVLRQQTIAGATTDYGLYRRPAAQLGLVGTTVASEAEPAASGLGLALSPNPTTGPARLRMMLAAPSSVVVTVYDALGRAVRVIAEGARAAGAHDVDWSAAGLRPGLYVIRAVADGQTATVRLTVVR